ncbi:DUF916 and DUF3324 domain-containing protein [Vagococcus zengguangii]|uniref:DUF916 and DUF3324 domain-containing protein n=2 Tax=Vagococcus zengguangii TaxID=2571750 RepID=A0A4D7CTB0_9ENTE|nr:DUF916 and DUF3324 domain-containing protein [Vagococcus zengguangii]
MKNLRINFKGEMKLVKKTFLLIVALFSSAVMGSQMVKASELNFSVDTILPENQREGSTYFDLIMEPNQEQEIVTKIRNHTDKEIEVEATVEPATTNVNGVVDYSKTETNVDDTAPITIKEIAKADKETVKIKANQTYDYKVKITMPDIAFDGVIAGGLTFKEVNDDSEANESEEQGMAIENKFAYSVALLVRQNETSLASDLKLLDVRVDQLNARNVIYSDLQNPVAKYLNQLNVEAKVTKKDKTEVIYETSNQSMQMAPNTTMAYPIRLEGEKLQPGKYTMHITATSGEDKWELEKDFEITAEKARELNKKDVSIEEDNSMLYIYIGIAVLALLMIIIIVLLAKKKKNND